MKIKVQNALKHVESGEIPDSDNIATEMINVLRGYWVYHATRLQNTTYDTGDMSFVISIFVAIPKKLAALECDQY